MAYTTIDKPSDYFDTKLYTGTDGSLNITGLDFQPDWVWCKNRASGNRHALFDSVRGVTKRIRTDGTDVEVADPDTLTSFNSDGFTVGADAEAYGANNDGDAFVSWSWKAGTSFSNDASSTSVGSIDSAGSVSTDAGFSIISFTDDGSNATIAHGLGVVPKAIIIKNRAAGEDWYSYWQPLGNDKQLRLSSTAAVADAGSMWNDTTPTSSVFSLDADAAGLSSGNYIAYCFAEKKGYSKIGSYFGNANDDGTFVHLGFKPAWVMIKNSTAGSTDWLIYDNKRGGPVSGVYGNNNKFFLRANTNGAEANETFHMFSNGFKVKITNAFLNGSGNKLIYMAFAENPFVTSTGVPTTAR